MKEPVWLLHGLNGSLSLSVVLKHTECSSGIPGPSLMALERIPSFLRVCVCRHDFHDRALLLGVEALLISVIKSKVAASTLHQ